MSGSSCISCQLFREYETHSQTVLSGFVDNIGEPIGTLFLAAVGLWVVWNGLKIAIGGKDLAGFLYEAFYVALGAAALVAVQNGMAILILETVISIASGMSTSIMGTAVSTVGSEGDLQSLVMAFEQVIRTVFNVCVALWEAATWRDVHFYFLGAVLAIPYVFLLVLVTAQVCANLMRITIVSLLSPILVMAAAFPIGRDMLMSGLRTVLTSVFTLFCVSSVFAIIAASVTQINPGSDATTAKEIADDLVNGPYLLSVVLGFLSAALLHEVTSVASAIGGSLQGAGAGMISQLTGAAAGKSGTAAKAGAGVAGRAGGLAASAGDKKLQQNETYSKVREPIGKVVRGAGYILRGSKK